MILFPYIKPTLLDRFLFAEAVEDPEIMQLLLEIILEREVRLDGLPQTEKEKRDSPRYRHVRLDVWARDLDNRIYDTEVQKRNTGNLPGAAATTRATSM